MERFLTLFHLHQVEALTADREVIGKEWIAYLKDRGISFRIRIPKNMKVRSSKSHQRMKISGLFRSLSFSKTMVLSKKRNVWGIPLHLVGLRTSEEYVILITNHEPYAAMNDYARRWEIETLFDSLKRRGFYLEDTHATEHSRLNELLALTWYFLQGEFFPTQAHTEEKARASRKEFVSYWIGILVKHSYQYPLQIQRLQKIYLFFVMYLGKIYTHNIE